MTSNYVCAGFETLASILNRFLNSSDWDNHFYREDIDRFFSNTTNKFLHSFGQNFKGAKDFNKFCTKKYDLLNRCRSYGFFQGSEFILDSGGFQASIGVFGADLTNELIELYHKFLNEYSDSIDRAFVLDLVPGPGCKLFEHFSEVYNKNLETYTRASNLPQSVKEKMTYIHHFRTPELWRIFKKLLKDEDLFSQFNYHATGGIVANQASDVQVPYIIYILPLIPLINEALKHNRSTLYFHILGGAGYRDVLFYEFFRKLVYEEHGLDLQISYDSSGIFKGLMIGRNVYVFDNGVVRKINLRERFLETRHKNAETINGLMERTLNDMANRHGFKELKFNSIYSEDSGTFHREVQVYLMLHMLDMYSNITNYAKSKVDELYPLYKSRELDDFALSVRDLVANFNGEKRTKKQMVKANSLINSLDLLKELDEDKCERLVTKFLAKDEFSELTDSTIKF